jgi:hypothetical protein
VLVSAHAASAREGNLRWLRVLITCCVGLIVLLVLFAPPAFAFPDVPDSHRYARAINELARLGFVSGRGDGTFGPDDPILRAQFAKMICGLLGIDVTEGQSFAPFVDLGPDNPADLYPHEFVGAAYQAGITRGRTATTFAPYTYITLVQVVTMVVRAADAFYPGLLSMPPADWWELWAHGDPDHGANIRRADYADLLTFLPIQDTASGVWRPASRGAVAQILVNLLEKHKGVRVAVNVEGHELDLTHPVYAENNRYYLPLEEIVGSLGGTVTVTDGAAQIQVNDAVVDLSIDGSYFQMNGDRFPLKKQARVSDGVVYVSLIDLQKMLHLKVVWDEDGGVLNLFWNKDNIEEDRQPQGGRTALVRFEDVTSGQTYRYSTAESLEKLRAIFDYCYAKAIPMQMGWIPRYIDPGNGIDNSLAQDYSMHNADFVYTLDYFSDRNGILGFHGYTHQYGNEVTIHGTEFDATHNTTESSIVKRLRYAINDANTLGLPEVFFESPHYAATTYQKSIMAKYFDVIYEYMGNPRQKNVIVVAVGNRLVKYIPTPLGYVDDISGTDDMLARIRALGDGDLASFFYHPNIEFDFINIAVGEDGYHSYRYTIDSPLRQVIDALIQRGYMFRSIDGL